MRRGGHIRVLATGFTPFPGAPVNPTEHLIRHFEVQPPNLGKPVDFRFAVLPVSWAGAVTALEALAEGFDPHVAVHFGLDATARGFRLETAARNAAGEDALDAHQALPSGREISPGMGSVRSSLPLSEIAIALEGQGLPVEWSDDAGEYLCNYVFFHSAAGLCRGLAAGMSGFVHVGPVSLPGAPAFDPALDFGQLVAGAAAILDVCAEHANVERARR